jgi:hypothetical protein
VAELNEIREIVRERDAAATKPAASDASCCAANTLADCCEPAAKVDCCGTTTAGAPGSCSCA